MIVHPMVSQGKLAARHSSTRFAELGCEEALVQVRCPVFGSPFGCVFFGPFHGTSRWRKRVRRVSVLAKYAFRRWFRCRRLIL